MIQNYVNKTNMLIGIFFAAMLTPYTACSQELSDSEYLFIAAGINDLPIVQGIVEGNPASVNMQDMYGRTPLHKSATFGCLAVAEFLVKQRAIVNAQDQFGVTPLHMAAERCHMNVATFLTNNGATIDTRDFNDSKMPLHYAAYAGSLPIAILLVRLGAEMDAQDNAGRTPIYMAALRGHLDIVRFLVEHGANFESRTDADASPDTDEADESPLTIALKSGHIDVATYLIKKHGAVKKMREGIENLQPNMLSERRERLLRILAELRVYFPNALQQLILQFVTEQ